MTITKNKKVNLKKIEDEIKKSHLEREYRGAFDNMLHVDMQVKCLTDEEYKKLMVENFGEVKYQDELLKQVNLLKARQAEVEFLRKLLCL